jgi:hypothetical protein
MEVLLEPSIMEFFVGEEGEEDILVWKYIDTYWYDVCPKVPIVEEIPSLWHELTGEYTLESSFSEESAGEAEITIIDNILVGSITFYANNFTAPIVANPISETEILVIGGPQEGETILYDSDNGSLKWGGFILKPIEQKMSTVEIQQIHLHDLLNHSRFSRR